MENQSLQSGKLHVVVKSPENTLFDGQAKSVSSTNEKGKFDILFNPANFISIVKKNIIIHIDNDQKKEFDIDRGIVRFYKNHVSIFLGIEAIPQIEIQAPITKPVFKD